jgi:ADP-heptose:LPS heptosyltransferase
MAGMRRAKNPPDLSMEKEIRSILVVRLKALGDIALSLPIVRALRNHFPDAEMRYLCRKQYAEALAGEASVDDIVTLPDGAWNQLLMIRELRRRGIDLTLDLLGSPRTANITFLTGSRIRIGMDVGRHSWCYTHLLPRAMIEGGRRVKRYTFDSNLEMIRMLNIPVPETTGAGSVREAESDRYAIGFPAAEAEIDWADDYVSRSGLEGRQLVGVVPIATYQSKSWPRENFIEIMQRMIDEHDLLPLVLWGPGEEEGARSVADAVPGAVLAPPTSISKLGALISRLDLLVTTDSGPKHLAVLIGVPTVTMFGPTDPEIWDPMNEIHRVIRSRAACFPCKKIECVPNSCLSDIAPDAVLGEIMDVLGLKSLEGNLPEGRS